MIVAQTSTVHELFLWDRRLIIQGEIWRIVTGNFTHTNFAHLLMNTSAFIIFYLMFKEYLSASLTLALLFIISVLVGLSIFITDIDYYSGLSGVIHGLFAWGAIRDIQANKRTGYWLLIGIIAKVCWEQMFGASESTVQLIDARVAIEAHLTGLLSGIAFPLFELVYRRIRC